MDEVEAKKITLISYVSEDIIQAVLFNKDQYIEYATYIYHDKDDDIMPHWHIYIWLTRSRKLAQVKEWFRDDVNGQNSRIERNTYANNQVIDYMLHVNEDSRDKGKHIYNISDIHFYKCKLEDFTYEKRDNSFNILTEVLEGTNYFVLAKKYGKDFIYHWKQYEELAVRLMGKNE